MTAKLSRAHPRMMEVLDWAESHNDPITENVEVAANEPGVNVPELSRALYDVLMERTGQKLYNKRHKAGQGRGFEFWRLLKRDFGRAQRTRSSPSCRCSSSPSAARPCRAWARRWTGGRHWAVS